MCVQIFRIFWSVSSSLISGEFCEIRCVCQCSGQVESCHRNDKRNPSSIMVRYQNAAITSKYAAITHRSLRWRFLCFFGLAFALRFLGLPCALRCRFAGALPSFLDRFLFFSFTGGTSGTPTDLVQGFGVKLFSKILCKGWTRGVC